MVYIEYGAFLTILIIVMYIFFDEEPMIDFSDVNGLHVSLFVLSILSVVAEDFIKSTLGQYVDLDRQVFFYATFKFSSMVIYFSFVLSIFFSHVTSSMLLDSVECVSMFFVFFDYSSTTLIKQLFLVFSIYILSMVASSKPHTAACGLAAKASAVVSSMGFVTTVWEFLFKSTSSSLDQRSNLLSPKSAKSPSSATYVGGLDFEWHSSSYRPVSMFFVDLMSSSFYILMIFSWAFLVFVNVIPSILDVKPSQYDNDDKSNIDTKMFFTLSASFCSHIIVVVFIFVVIMFLFWIRTLLSTSWFSSII